MFCQYIYLIPIYNGKSYCRIILYYVVRYYLFKLKQCKCFENYDGISVVNSNLKVLTCFNNEHG